MSDTNLTAILKKQGDIQLEDIPIPEPGPGEVQLCMQHVGICGSDVHYWKHGAIGDFVVKAPMILGHEASGVISKLGKGVSNLKIGDRVAIEPGVPCRLCSHCKHGRYNLCPDMKFCATPPIHGNLARYYVHAADFCFKLPDNMSTEDGALLEPLSVGVHACNRGGVTLGSKVLICGAGPIGLVNVLTAKANGAAVVCITVFVSSVPGMSFTKNLTTKVDHIDQSRLDMAKSMGATYTLKVTSKDPKEMAQKVEDVMGVQPEITIECSGATPSIQTAIYATKSGGCVVLVGLGQADITLPIVNASVREVDIRGIFRYVNCYPTALAMVASGKVDVKPLITHRFKLEDTLKAFETTFKGEGIKVMIECAKK